MNEKKLAWKVPRTRTEPRSQRERDGELIERHIPTTCGDRFEHTTHEGNKGYRMHGHIVSICTGHGHGQEMGQATGTSLANLNYDLDGRSVGQDSLG